jgi:hypothetical protein
MHVFAGHGSEVKPHDSKQLRRAGLAYPLLTQRHEPPQIGRRSNLFDFSDSPSLVVRIFAFIDGRATGEGHDQ